MSFLTFKQLVKKRRQFLSVQSERLVMAGSVEDGRVLVVLVVLAVLVVLVVLAVMVVLVVLVVLVVVVKLMR